VRTPAGFVELRQSLIEAVQTTEANQAGCSFHPALLIALKGHTPALGAEFKPGIGGTDNHE
jgi:hypothetical protein